MSNYRDKAINPRTGQIEDADFLDNHFGRHQYGIRFDGEAHVYPAGEVEVPKPAPAPEQGGE